MDANSLPLRHQEADSISFFFESRRTPRLALTYRMPGSNTVCLLRLGLKDFRPFNFVRLRNSCHVRGLATLRLPCCEEAQANHVEREAMQRSAEVSDICMFFLDLLPRRHVKEAKCMTPANGI